MLEQFNHKKDEFRRVLNRWVGNPNDPLSFAISNLDYFRAAMAILSILTLHILFFCFNLDSPLWPLIDLSFVANITFTFGLFVALALFSIRVFPVAASVLVTLSLLIWLTVVTTIRHRKSKSRYSQPSAMKDLVERMNDTDKGTKKALRVVFLFPFPSKAAMRLLENWQDRFADKYLPKVSILGYVTAILLICFFYTGFKMLVYLILTAYFFLAFVISVNRERVKAILLFLTSFFVAPFGVTAQKFLELDDFAKKNTVNALLVAAGALAAAAGELRFEMLRNAPPVGILQAEGRDDSSTGVRITASQFASSSKGIFINTAEYQAFIPYDSIMLVESSR